MKILFFLVCLGCGIIGLSEQQAQVNKDDFRNEFDHLLIQLQVERMHALEHKLYQISREIILLEQTKTKTEQELIITEIGSMIAFTQGSEAALKRELTRTDLNLLERFNFEATLATAEVLIKDLKIYEARARAVPVH